MCPPAGEGRWERLSTPRGSSSARTQVGLRGDTAPRGAGHPGGRPDTRSDGRRHRRQGEHHAGALRTDRGRAHALHVQRTGRVQPRHLAPGGDPRSVAPTLSRNEEAALSLVFLEAMPSRAARSRSICDRIRPTWSRGRGQPTALTTFTTGAPTELARPAGRAHPDGRLRVQGPEHVAPQRQHPGSERRDDVPLRGCVPAASRRCR